jgi:hypothetical protein
MIKLAPQFVSGFADAESSFTVVIKSANNKDI